MLFDFGLVVLVWLVQLVIYPSFHFFSAEGLNIWHHRYTNKVTWVVLPLMVGQLATHVLILYDSFTFFSCVNFLLVLSTWLITFLFAVPAHRRISIEQEVTASIDQLVKVNWWRTIIWSLIFLITFMLRRENPLQFY